MSAELQILNKSLTSKDIGLLERLDDSYFRVYKDEYNFIKTHFKEYGEIPDKLTVLDKFPDFNITDVYEADEYLYDEISEQKIYGDIVPIVQEVAKKLQTNSVDALAFLKANLNNIEPPKKSIGTNIIADFDDRYKEYTERSENKERFVITTGFKELDDITGGWERGEELVVIFARTGNGKTWIMTKALTEAWKAGNRVGLIEPEMSARKVGYRFDSLYGHISNRALLKGEATNGYKKYGESLKAIDIPFIVARPSEFSGRITVSKLRNFVKDNQLDVLAIDGVHYLDDERAKKSDSVTQCLTRISEDLMDLSIELKIPILVVAQSNREGVREDVPGLENIRDSDGISHNCSIALSARSKDGYLELKVQKNRNGNVGDKLVYSWLADTGDFAYVNEDEEMSSAREYKGAVPEDVF